MTGIFPKSWKARWSKISPPRRRIIALLLFTVCCAVIYSQSDFATRRSLYYCACREYCADGESNPATFKYLKAHNIATDRKCVSKCVTAEREQWGHDPGRNSGGGVVGGGCFSGGCATTGASYPTQCNDGPTPNQKYNSLIKAADDGGYESQKELCNYPHTLTKYCVLAAAQGNRAASYVAGQNYYNGVDVQKNYTEAYFWLTVATRDTQCLGTADINLANKNLSDIQKTLSADEVSDIQKRVDDWKTAHPFNKGCE